MYDIFWNSQKNPKHKSMLLVFIDIFYIGAEILLPIIR